MDPPGFGPIATTGKTAIERRTEIDQGGLGKKGSENMRKG